MKNLVLILSLFVIAACSTHPHSDGRDAYEELIADHSAGDKQFSGVYENFEFRATIFNRKVSSAIHDRLAKYYAWDEQTANEKRQERMSELNTKSKVWLSFYTPNAADDNLSNKKNIWKVYLVNRGQRYEGHVYKALLNKTEARALISYHNRWTTAYFIDFPLPTDELDEHPTLIITGPLGHRQVTF